MLRSKILLLSVLILAASPVAADWPIPSVDFSIVSLTEYAGPGTLVLMVLPDGSGPSYAQAREMNTGIEVDATVEMTIYDAAMYPMFGFPYEDVWLEPADGVSTLATCVTGGLARVHPDWGSPSDVNGRFFFSGPPAAGGWSEGISQGYVVGEPLRSGPGVAVRFVSPDINGDLVVNLTDSGFFALDLFVTYHFRSDFNADGVINLSDSGFMATSIGISCN